MEDRRGAIVEVVEDGQEFPGQLHELALPQHRAGLHPLPQRGPVDELLDDVDGTRVLVALEEVEDPGDARMLQTGQNRRFALEELQVLPRIDPLVPQLLDGDPAVLLSVVAQYRPTRGTLSEES